MRIPISILLVAASCMTVAPYALALAPMQDVSEFARTTSPLTSAQKKMLDTFIARGIRGLKSDVPQDVINSRQTLIQPLTRIGTSAVFREAFCDMFLEKAREIFEESEAFNSQNAFLVLAYVRTGDSTEYLARNLNKSTISNDARRIAASSMLVLSLRTTPAELIRPRQFNSIIRSIVTGSEQETSWVVLQHDFEALVEIGSDPNVPDEIRANAIEQEAHVLKATLDRISQGNSTQLARSISPIILLLRSQYISLEGSIRRDFVSNIPPALVTVIDAGERAWGDIRANALLEKSYGDAIYQATVLARLVAGGSRAPSSDPADYWRRGDRGSYSQTVQEWMRLGRG